jgi:protein-S-isoprenylcysteine O-methyltransferase Ste14
MPDLEDSDAEYISRRVVARSALRKIATLVSTWEEEEKEKSFLIRVILISLLSIILFLFIVLPIFIFAFHSHPKVQLFAGSIIVGAFVGIALILWNKFSGKK